MVFSIFLSIRVPLGLAQFRSGPKTVSQNQFVAQTYNVLSFDSVTQERKQGQKGGRDQRKEERKILL